MGYGSHELDTFAIGEQMTKKGWFVSTMSDPPGIHMGMPTLAHVGVVDEYLADLAEAVATVRAEKLTAKVARSLVWRLITFAPRRSCCSAHCWSLPRSQSLPRQAPTPCWRFAVSRA
jgi:hypothetical protein